MPRRITITQARAPARIASTATCRNAPTWSSTCAATTVFAFRGPTCSATLGTPNACSGCHSTNDAKWAAEQLEHWYGHQPQGFQHFAEAFAQAEHGAAAAGASLADLAGDRSNPAIVRSSALEALARYPDAARRLRRRRERSPIPTRWYAARASASWTCSLRRSACPSSPLCSRIPYASCDWRPRQRSPMRCGMRPRTSGRPSIMPRRTTSWRRRYNADRPGVARGTRQFLFTTGTHGRCRSAVALSARPRPRVRTGLCEPCRLAAGAGTRCGSRDACCAMGCSGRLEPPRCTTRWA